MYVFASRMTRHLVHQPSRARWAGCSRGGGQREPFRGQHRGFHPGSARRRLRSPRPNRICRHHPQRVLRPHSRATLLRVEPTHCAVGRTRRCLRVHALNVTGHAVFDALIQFLAVHFTSPAFTPGSRWRVRRRHFRFASHQPDALGPKRPRAGTRSISFFLVAIGRRRSHLGGRGRHDSLLREVLPVPVGETDKSVTGAPPLPPLDPPGHHAASSTSSSHRRSSCTARHPACHERKDSAPYRSTDLDSGRQAKALLPNRSRWGRHPPCSCQKPDR